MKNKKNKRVDVRKMSVRLLFFGVLLYGVITFAGQQLDLSRLGKKEADWKNKIADENAETPRLEEEYKNVNTDEYIEKKVREMGYVRPDETIYYDAHKSE